MANSVPQTAYRILQFQRQEGDKPKKYRCTYELIDENTDRRLAACDLIGQACFSALAIQDHHAHTWQMRPNRAFMPSRWIVSAPDGRVAMQFHQNIPAKLFNPFGRVALTLKDAAGAVRFRVMDSNSSLLDRIFGGGPSEWAIVENKLTVAKLTRLPKKGEAEQAPGLWGKLKKFIKGSDQAIVYSASTPAFSAPVALGMVMVLNELLDTSGA